MLVLENTCQLQPHPTTRFGQAVRCLQTAPYVKEARVQNAGTFECIKCTAQILRGIPPAPPPCVSRSSPPNEIDLTPG
jgi:hypothetical protein